MAGGHVLPPAALTAALADAREACRRLAARHYENFPVGRWGVPADRRPDLHAIYAFARIADDYADEPEWEGRRLERLDEWGRRLETCEGGTEHPVFLALGDTIRRRGLPLQPFRDLLSAFRQDAVRSRYETWEEVLDYCRRSANPVGRLVLAVTGQRDEALSELSDALCTGLQLANFWQDLSVDHSRGRSYVPRVDAARHGVDLESLVRGGRNRASARSSGSSWNARAPSSSGRGRCPPGSPARCGSRSPRRGTGGGRSSIARRRWARAR